MYQPELRIPHRRCDTGDRLFGIRLVVIGPLRLLRETSQFVMQRGLGLGAPSFVLVGPIRHLLVDVFSSCCPLSLFWQPLQADAAARTSIAEVVHVGEARVGRMTARGHAFGHGVPFGLGQLPVFVPLDPHGRDGEPFTVLEVRFGGQHRQIRAPEVPEGGVWPPFPSWN